MDHLEVLRDIILGALAAEMDSGEWEFTDAEVIAALHLAAQEYSRDYLDANVYISEIEIEFEDGEEDEEQGGLSD